MPRFVRPKIMARYERAKKHALDNASTREEALKIIKKTLNNPKFAANIQLLETGINLARLLQSSERARLRKAIEEYNISGSDSDIENSIKQLLINKLFDGKNAEQVKKTRKLMEETIDARKDLSEKQKEQLKLKYTYKITIAELEVQIKIYQEQLAKAIRLKAMEN